MQALDDFLDRRASCPGAREQSGNSHIPLRATKSLNNSPRLGIPLGTMTAQMASKSFWNPDMLKRNMEQIAQTAVREASCLGSSLESLHDSEGDFSDREIIQVSEEEIVCEQTRLVVVETSTPAEDRELRNPYTVFLQRKCKGTETPPYLSPGITRRVNTERT